MLCGSMICELIERPEEMPGRWSALKQQYFYALHAAVLENVVGIMIYDSDEEETTTILVL